MVGKLWVDQDVLFGDLQKQSSMVKLGDVGLFGWSGQMFQVDWCSLVGNEFFVFVFGWLVGLKIIVQVVQ